MKQLVEVTFKDGSKAKVLPGEVEGLRKAGLLKNPVKKEEKKAGETKEFKSTGRTKERTAKEIQEANEKMYPSKKRPVNIGMHSFKGGRPKKT